MLLAMKTLCSVVAVALFAAFACAAVPSTNPADLEQDAIARIAPPAAFDVIGKHDINDVPLDAKVDAFFAEHQADFDQLRRAAALPVADWGDTTSDLSRVMKNLNARRHATNLLWLRARWDQQHGRPAEAVDDLLTSMALARHVGQGRLLVCHLVEIGCSAGACRRMAEMLPSLPLTVVEKMPGQLDALPPSATLAEILDGEQSYAKVAAFQQLAGPHDDPVAQATAPAAVAGFSTLSPVYDAAKAAATKSPTEFDAAIDAAVAAMPDNVYARIIAPALKRARQPSAEMDAHLAMLRTAIAISISGPSAVDDSVDPFGGAPFIRRDTPGGYTLESHLVSRGKPVTLRVGQ